MKRRVHFMIFGFLAIVLVITMTLHQPAQAATCAQNYIVRRGDTLFRIGLRFGVRWTVLQALNGLRNPNFIIVGEQLCVRRSGQPRAATAASNKGTGGSTTTFISGAPELDPKTITNSAGPSIAFLGGSSYSQSTMTRFPWIVRWL